jgi:hypothetical protein
MMFLLNESDMADEKSVIDAALGAVGAGTAPTAGVTD